jgi:hypothetical protein
LFTPRLHRGDYSVYTSPIGIDRLLQTLAADTALLRPPGAWTPRGYTPGDAFGEASEYDRWKIARLYGSRRARVARGPRFEGGRVTEAWTLVSPYPDPSLDRLDEGTLVIVLRIRGE